MMEKKEIICRQKAVQRTIVEEQADGKLSRIMKISI